MNEIKDSFNKIIDKKFEEFIHCYEDIKIQNKKIIDTLSFLSSKYEEFQTKITKLEEKTNELSLKFTSEVTNLRKTVMDLERDKLFYDQLPLSNNIELMGVPEEVEDLLHCLTKIGSSVGCPIKKEDVDSIHRSNPRNRNSKDGNKPRPRNIIVKLTSKIKKDELLAAVKKNKGVNSNIIGLKEGKLYLNDHLTWRSKMLLRAAKTFKLESSYSFLWVRNSKIYLRKNEVSAPICLTSILQLDMLKK
jgi:hypothetical protein